MVVFRLLALIFTIAAVVFGGLQLWDHVEGVRESLTVQLLWERIDAASLTSVLEGLGSNSLWLSTLSVFLALPAWILCLVLALVCRLAAGARRPN